jgi:hypothetical protein
MTQSFTKKWFEESDPVESLKVGDEISYNGVAYLEIIEILDDYLVARQKKFIIPIKNIGKDIRIKKVSN